MSKLDELAAILDASPNKGQIQEVMDAADKINGRKAVAVYNRAFDMLAVIERDEEAAEALRRGNMAQYNEIMSRSLA